MYETIIIIDIDKNRDDYSRATISITFDYSRSVSQIDNLGQLSSLSALNWQLNTIVTRRNYLTIECHAIDKLIFVIDMNCAE